MVFNRYICSVLLGFAGWLFYAPVTSAEIVNDPYITSATISSTSTTVGASGVTYTVGFVLNQAVPVDNNINVLISSTTGCRTDWEACQPNLSSATFSGVAGTTATLDGRNITLRATTELIAGSYTLTISNATNPTKAAALRAFVATSASDEAVLLTDFNSNNWYVTASSNVVNVGTLVVSGTVTGGGVAMSDRWVQMYNANWSVSNGASTDSKGYYAIFADYDAAGYWASGAYTLTANAAEGSGYINTSATITYNGSPLVQDISLSEANTFFSGTVTYSDAESSTVSVQAGAPVTDANVCFYTNDGSGSYCDATDAQGQYTVALLAGSYQANVSSVNWEELVNWRYQNEGGWYEVAATGTETVNFEVDATISLLSGTVAVPDGSVALDGSINLTNKEVNYWGSVTDGGYLLNLNPGTYTLSFSPDTWSSNSAWGKYSYTGTVTIIEGENEYNFTVDELTATVLVTVTNAAGEPVEGIQANMWSPNHWAGGQTSSAGVKELYGYAGQWYDVNVWDETYLATEPNQKIQLVDNETIAVNFVVQQPDATITATFVNSDGTVPGELRGWFGCNTDNYRRNYGTDLRNGTVELGVVVDPDTGEFDGQCSAWFPDESAGAVSPQDVLVIEGGTATLEFTLQPLDATVRAVIKNFATGNKIDADPNIHVNLWNQADDMGHYAQLSENPVDISVVSGKSYSGGIWSDSAQYIPLWSMNNEAIQVASGETETLILNVLQSEGSLRVNAKDPNGDPVEFGWAWCGNWEEVDFALDTQATNTVINTGGEIRNGVANVPLVSGHSYRCGVGAPPEFIERGWLSPTEQAVEYASKNAALPELTFKFKEADANLTGAISLGADVTGISAAADLDKMFCWAWSEGGSSWTEVDPGEEYRLNVSTDQEQWEAGCDGVDGEDWYFTEKPYEFSPKKGANTHDFTLTKMAGWKLYEAVSETFDATENKVILYGDGTKVTIPAGTLASEGNVTVRGTPETNIIRTDDKPAYVPVDWEALDESGNLIETFPGGTVTIEIPYSDEVLAEFGIEEAALIGKYWDEINGAWMQPDNVTQDTANNIVTIVTDHFTQYGVTYNGRVANTRKPNKPALTVKSSGKHNAKLVLRTKKTSPKATRFVVQVRKFGVSGKGNVETTKFRNSKEKARLVRSIQKLKRSTNYEVHAKACNSAGCSDSSAWKNFQTE